MKQEREQLVRRKVQTGSFGLDQSVEMLGQKPETVSAFYAATFGRIADAVEMAGRRRIWQICQGVESQKLAGQEIEQEFARAVGKGGDPFPNSRASRVQTREPVHQATDAQPGDEIEGDDALQQTDHVMPIGMQKVRQQAMRATTDLAPNPMDQDVVGDVVGAGPSLVGAPTDQAIAGPAVGVRTGVWDGEAATGERNGVSVLLYRTGEVLYNNHVLGTPPSSWSGSQISGHDGRCRPFWSRCMLPANSVPLSPFLFIPSSSVVVMTPFYLSLAVHPIWPFTPKQ